MSGYLLDTNVLIAFSKDTAGRIGSRLLRTPGSDLFISALVAHELFWGAYRSQRVPENLERLRVLLSDFTILPFDEADARAAGEIRAALYARGTPIGPYDTLIAGQARARNLTLVTNNTREFQRVAGLKIEDWSA